MSKIKKIALSSLSGLLVVFSFPNFLGVELFLLQWFALVPLCFAFQDSRPRHAFFCGWLTGTVINAGGMYWLMHLLQVFGGLPPFVSFILWWLLSAYHGLLYGLWASATRWATAKGFSWWLVAPSLFVALEGLVPILFPWYFGNGQYRFVHFVQIADITGVAGVSFVLVWINVAVYLSASSFAKTKRFAWRPLGWGACLLAAVLGYGHWRIGVVEDAVQSAKTLRLGLIEGDIGIWEKEAQSVPRELRYPTLLHNLIRHQRLSQEAERGGAELIVWSESACPTLSYGVKRTDLFATAAVGGRVQNLIVDTWSEGQPLPEGTHTLRAMWSGSEDDIWAVGDRGTVLRWKGDGWERIDLGLEEDLFAVHGVRGVGLSQFRIWIAGAGGVFRERTLEGEWVSHPWPQPDTIRGLSVDPQTGGPIAVGDSGRIMRWKRDQWLPQKSGTHVTLQAIHTGFDGDPIVVGDGGTVLRRRKSRWVRETFPERVDLKDVADAGPHRLFVVGSGGALYRFQEDQWKRETLEPPQDLVQVSGEASGRVYVAGAEGHVWTETEDGGWRSLEPPESKSDPACVVAVGYDRYRRVPSDVAWFRVSDVPLPKSEGVVEAFREESEVWPADRTALMRGFRKPLLFGILLQDVEPDEEGRQRIYNAALMIDERGKVLGRFDKNFLLMFGESFPFGETFPILYDWFPQVSRFESGKDVAVFEWKDMRFGPLICYEDIIPSFVARTARLNPHVLINITNDAWFGKTAEPYLHMAVSAMRAVETRKWLTRTTNTGVSVFIDPVGRIESQTSLEDEEVLLGDVRLLDQQTLYVTLGDAFTWLAMAVSLLTLIGARRQRSRSEEAST